MACDAFISCGFQRDEDTSEANTQWVRNRTNHSMYTGIVPGAKMEIPVTHAEERSRRSTALIAFKTPGAYNSANACLWCGYMPSRFAKTVNRSWTMKITTSQRDRRLRTGKGIRYFTGIGILALLGAASLCNADIIYGVDLTIGAGTVTGDIVTDGTIGVLGAGDIVDWNLQLNDGSGSPDAAFDLLGPLSGSNSAIFFAGADLSATPSQLLFDFDPPSGDEVVDTSSFTLLFPGPVHYVLRQAERASRATIRLG
jgi:hypothetical protein